MYVLAVSPTNLNVRCIEGKRCGWLKDTAVPENSHWLVSRSEGTREKSQNSMLHKSSEWKLTRPRFYDLHCWTTRFRSVGFSVFPRPGESVRGTKDQREIRRLPRVVEQVRREAKPITSFDQPQWDYYRARSKKRARSCRWKSFDCFPDCLSIIRSGVAEGNNTNERLGDEVCGEIEMGYFITVFSFVGTCTDCSS